MPAPNKRLEAILVAVVAIACMIVVAVQGPIPGLRAIAAVLLACVLPGYAVIGALPIRKEMGALERTALSIGLSLAVAAIGAVGLTVTPWGIQTWTWAVLLGGITLAASGVALLRRHETTEPRPAGPRLTGRSVLLPGVLFGVAVLITGGALLIAGNVALDQNRPDFTQLWLQPTANDSEIILVGIHNAQRTPLAGRLEVKVGPATVAEWPSITVAPDGTWEQQVTIPGFASQAEPAIATLYRQDSADPYRTASLWPQ